MTPETKDGRTVYRCVYEHDHAAMTFAVLCEQAPKLQVQASFRIGDGPFDASNVVAGYECLRCGAWQRSLFPDLVSREDGTVGRTISFKPLDDADVERAEKDVRAWRSEARAFHEAHTGCNAEANHGS